MGKLIANPSNVPGHAHLVPNVSGLDLANVARPVNTVKAYAQCLEIPITRLSTDGSLTFKDPVNTYWPKIVAVDQVPT